MHIFVMKYSYFIHISYKQSLNYLKIKMKENKTFDNKSDPYNISFLADKYRYKYVNYNSNYIIFICVIRDVCSIYNYRSSKWLLKTNFSCWF